MTITALIHRGFTADEIVAGFISADRIEAGTIAVSKLVPNAGTDLNISGNTSLASNSIIAPPAFSTSKSYAVGQMVTYGGKIYRFTTAHPAGAWNASHVTETSLGTAIDFVPGMITTTITDSLGNYYTKTETATQISTYVGNNAYGKISGITINSDGVSITGSKYVKISASANDYWTYDQNGFQHVNSSGHKFVITDQSLTSDSAIKGGIRYSSTTNGGKIEIYVQKANSSAFGDLMLETSSTNIVYLYASGTRFVNLGKYEYPFANIYTQNIVGRQGTTNGQLTHSLWMFLTHFDPDNPGGAITSGAYLYFTAYDNDTSGNIHVSNTGGIYFESSIHCGNIYYGDLIQTSSRDVKHDIVSLDSYGERIGQLRPGSFVYDVDPDDKRRIGLIYEETVDVMPEICVDNDGDKAISYVELIPVLLKEIQDLRKRVKDLEEM